MAAVVKKTVIQRAIKLLHFTQSSLFSVTVETVSVTLIWVEFHIDKYLEKCALANVPSLCVKGKVAGASKQFMC